jgi:hypothetical protein
MNTDKKFNSLSEFYPYYLSEHQNKMCRILHFTGTSLFFYFLFATLLSGNLTLLIFCPISGYGFAWIGHFFFERNKPATFKYPLYSLLSDFKLYFDILQNKQKFDPTK